MEEILLFLTNTHFSHIYMLLFRVNSHKMCTRHFTYYGKPLVIKRNQAASRSWQFDELNDLLNILLLTAPLRSCKLKAMTSFIEYIHLVFLFLFYYCIQPGTWERAPFFTLEARNLAGLQHLSKWLIISRHSKLMGVMN